MQSPDFNSRTMEFPFTDYKTRSNMGLFASDWSRDRIQSVIFPSSSQPMSVEAYSQTYIAKIASPSVQEMTSCNMRCKGLSQQRNKSRSDHIEAQIYELRTWTMSHHQIHRWYRFKVMKRLTLTLWGGLELQLHEYWSLYHPDNRHRCIISTIRRRSLSFFQFTSSAVQNPSPSYSVQTITKVTITYQHLQNAHREKSLLIFQVRERRQPFPKPSSIKRPSTNLNVSKVRNDEVRWPIGVASVKKINNQNVILKPFVQSVKSFHSWNGFQCSLFIWNQKSKLLFFPRNLYPPSFSYFFFTSVLKLWRRFPHWLMFRCMYQNRSNEVKHVV